MPRVCSSCGCACEGCYLIDNKCSLDLQQRIEELQSQLLRSHAHISNMEQEFMSNKQVLEYEIMKVREELIKLRDRYERLLESHKRIQRVNHSLEDKLLKVVNVSEKDKTEMQKEMAALTSSLVDARATVCSLEEENDRYRTDCNLAVQLLHCKPSNFVSQRLTTLPLELQERVKCHLTSDQLIAMDTGEVKETTKLIRVPMQTFPPTAMVYSVPSTKSNTDKEAENENRAQTVPMSVIAKVLTQQEPKRKPQRTYICTKCGKDYTFADKEVQTYSIKENGKGGNSTGPKVHRPGRSRNSSTETEI